MASATGRPTLHVAVTPDGSLSPLNARLVTFQRYAAPPESRRTARQPLRRCLISASRMPDKYDVTTYAAA